MISGDMSSVRNSQSRCILACAGMTSSDVDGLSIVTPVQGKEGNSQRIALRLTKRFDLQAKAWPKGESSIFLHHGSHQNDVVLLLVIVALNL